MKTFIVSSQIYVPPYTDLSETHEVYSCSHKSRNLDLTPGSDSGTTLKIIMNQVALCVIMATCLPLDPRLAGSNPADAIDC
jgi:hypothetical protein